jgi:hypothetical protein
MTDPFGSQSIDVLEETTTTTIGGQNSIEIIEETATIEVIDAGFQGPPGASAYELAVAQGYGGTLDQWLQMQRGVVILEAGETTPPIGTPDDTIVFVKI